MILLVDAQNLYVRAHYAVLDKDITANGLSTGSMLVFINSLGQLVRDTKPDKVAVCWDHGKSKFRTELLPSYKANRSVPEFKDALDDGKILVQTLLALCAVPQVARSGYEADDVIAGFWRMADEDVQIVSNDKDLTQLCGTINGHTTEVLRISSFGTSTDIWGESDVRSHFGVPPEDVPMLLALMGDKADNIPGIPGIGIKRAAKIIEDAGHNNVQVFDHPKVADRKDQVRRNLILTNLRAPLPGMELRPVKPFDPVTPRHQDWTELDSFLQKYQLRTVREKIMDGTFWRRSDNVFGG